MNLLNLIFDKPEYAIDTVNGAAIRGWVWDPSAPTKKVAIEVLADDRVVARCLADEFREDLRQAGKADGRCAFNISTPADLQDGRPHNLAFRVEGKRRPFHLYANLILGRPTDVEACVDEISPTVISGWAWRPGVPEERVVIELVKDGRVLAEALANRYRQDLYDAHKGDGSCAFGIEIPQSLKDGRAHDVLLRVRGQPNALHTFTNHSFLTVNCEVEKFSLSRVSALAWAQNEPYFSVGSRVLLDGFVIGETKADFDHRIEFTPKDLKITMEIAADIAKKASVDLSLEVNGRTVSVLPIDVRASASGEFVTLVDEHSPSVLRGRIVRSNTSFPKPDIGLRLNGEASGLFPLQGDGCFGIDLCRLQLPDGQHILSLGDPGADKNDLVNFDVDFTRLSVDLRVEGHEIVGALRDNWRANEIGLELLIDGKPVSGVTAKPDSTLAASQHRFSVALSPKWRDGAPHTAQVRVLGSKLTLPPRPLMFMVGTPDNSALVRVELLGDGLVKGFVLIPGQPDAIATVSLMRGETIIDRVLANQPHDALMTDDVLPVTARGFSLNVVACETADYVLRIDALGRRLRDIPLTLPLVRGPFVVEDAGSRGTGLCFVLPDPTQTSASREDARTILLAAMAAIEAGATDVTLALLPNGKNGIVPGSSLKTAVVDLIGTLNAPKLANARIVVVPEPAIGISASGFQGDAAKLDLWLRTNDFARVVGSSRSGILAYFATSQRQGLTNSSAAITVLAGTFVVPDRLANELLLDEPGLIMEEALERAALLGADQVLVPNRSVMASLEEIAAQASAKAVLSPCEIGMVRGSPASADRNQTRWLVFVGPLQAQNGLITVCDALDRLARTTPKFDTHSELSVAFVGPSDWVRGQNSVAYLLDRAKKWPFAIRTVVDLNWDGYARALDSFRDGIRIAMPQGDGTAWDALCRVAGLRRLDWASNRSDNATALATALAAAIANPSGVPCPAQLAQSTIGAALVAAQKPSRPATAALAELPLVSICVSHFNRPTLLRKTLASIDRCDYPNREIIVLDGGSTLPEVRDELVEIEAWLRERNGRIVFDTDRYLGAARNAAARAAKGTVLVFMDDDNLARPAMIRRFLETLQRTGAEICTSRMAFFTGIDDIDPSCDVPAQIGVPLMPDKACGALSNCFGDANMMITRSAFERVGGFTEDFGRGHEDWELYARASMLGIRQELVNEPLFWYRVAPTSMLRTRANEEIDLQRSIRAYSHELPTEIYRIIQLAQGLLHRWDRTAGPTHQAAVPGLVTASEVAWGRVAVIMRTKDRPLLLERAIDSVINQTFTDWVLVVVNDGGNPEPVQRLLDARKSALRGRYLLINHETSMGMESASNAGVTNSASEFLVVHDDDDSWETGFLERCVGHLDGASPETAGVVTYATIIVEEIQGNKVIEHSRQLFKNYEALELTRMSAENQFPPITFLFRRSVMDDVGQFDGALPVLGDWDFHLRVMSRYRIDLLREPLANYHHRSQGQSGNYANTVIAMREVHRVQRANYINKHLRSSITSGKISEGELLYFGDMKAEIQEKFHDIKSLLLWIEELINDRAKHSHYIENLLKNLPQARQQEPSD